jgi:adenosine deaminase
VLELARRNGITLPYDTVENLRAWYQFRDFGHFVEVYGGIGRCLRTAEDFELIAYECAAELARQNCHYAEIGFTPFFHARAGVDHDVFFGGLSRARERARTELGVEIAWIFDIGRGARGGASEDRRWADYTTTVAISDREEGVIGLGLGGPEAGNPPERYTANFDRARAAGLRSYPHAGEHAGPVSVRGALDALGAERIPHGVRATEDPALVAEIAERGVALDVCPTSNVCLGVVPSLEAHPMRALYAAGVPVTVNSDDPPLFNTTLNNEAALLCGPLGFSVEQADEILLNGVRYCFLDPDAKAQRLAEHTAELERLKAIHLAE